MEPVGFSGVPMPGLSLAIELDDHPPALEAARTWLAERVTWPAQLLIDEDRTLVAFAAPEHYPLARYDGPAVAIFVEGRIYDKSPATIGRELGALAEPLFASRTSGATLLSEWLRGTDGDFLVVIRRKPSGEIVIVNDLFGRLPLYCRIARERVLLSRDLRFVAAAAGQTEFDRMAIAQTLLLRYPLGTRTLVARIDRLPPATVVRIEPTHGRVTRETVHAFNFEEQPSERPGADVSALVDAFRAACASRACAPSQSPAVVSLSGGLDSRAVAAGLRAAAVPFECATYLDAAGVAGPEVRIASQLAGALGAPWHRYPLPPPSLADALELLTRKAGMNSVMMSYMLHFYRALRARHGAGLVLFTGAGGDKLLPDLRPARTIRSLTNLVAHVVATSGILPLDTGGALTGLRANDIRAEIATHLAGYPERDPADKLVRFAICERAYKWLFEGEDRNRSYLWTVTPFYSPVFFRIAMGIPHRRKARYRLYRDFLHRLSPAAASVPNANWRYPVGVARAGLFLGVSATVARLPGPLRAMIAGRGGGTPPPCLPCARLRECIVEAIDGCPAVARHLDADAVRRSVGRTGRQQFLTLLTIVGAIELLALGRSTFERYGEATLP